MKKLILIYILFVPLLSHGQIPIKNLSLNILNFDKNFDSIATANKYNKTFNNYYNFSDIDKDGKPDMLMYAYQKSSDVTLNIFYNTSTETQYSFQNKYNYFIRGNQLSIDVGDINNDGKLDILAPTENYHGLPADKSVEYYPNNTDNTPDKLFIQNSTGFTEFTQPDTLNTINGRFVDTDGDGSPEWISSNYYKPNNGNYMWHYKFKNNTIERSFILEAENNHEGYLYIGSIDKIEDEKYFYLPYKTYDRVLIPNREIPTFNYVLRFKKGQPKYILGIDCDTIATIPYPILSYNGLSYFYEVCNEDGIKLVDLDNDGKPEVITMRFLSYLNGIKDWEIGEPPISILKIYDKVGNDLTDKFIDKNIQSDPTNYYATLGFVYTDINGDGLKDILPKSNWGWVNWPINDQNLRLKKYILLNTGNFFKGFYLNLNNIPNIGVLEGFNNPINLNPGKAQSILIASKNTNNGVANILDLDFSQFQFPCTNFPPKLNLTGNKIFCTNSDSAIMITDSIVGYKTVWYKNGLIIKTSNQFVIKDTGTYKVNVINLGGCQIEKTFTVIKNPIPTAPNLSRDTANNLLSGATGTTWYKDGTVLTDTSQKYKPTTPGSYTAKTTLNGCTSVMSAAYYYLVTDIINLSKDEYIKLAPNPFINQLNIDFVIKGYQRLNLEVFDMANGTKVVSKQGITAGMTIFLNQLSAGTYVIKVTSNDNKIAHQFKMVKL